MKIKNKCWIKYIKKFFKKHTHTHNTIFSTSNVHNRYDVWSAHRPHHTSRAADWDGGCSLTWGGKELRKLKEATIDESWFRKGGRYWLRRVEKDVHICVMSTELVWMRVGFGLRNGLGYWRWSLKRPASAVPANCCTLWRDRRAATDVLCGTINLSDQCLVESTAQTKLVRLTEREIQQQPEIR